MKIRLLTLSSLLIKSLACLKAAKVRLGPLCSRTWAVLNRNLVEGIVLPHRCLAVCVERGGVSVASGERFLNRRLLKGSKRYVFEEGGYPAPDDIAAAASLAMKELKVKEPHVLLGVPREWVVIRTAGLPPTVKENIQSVVAYEMDRLTPLAAADAMYDFVVGAEMDGKLPISLMAARKEILSPYVAALTEKGFPPVMISTPSVGMARICGCLAGPEAVAFLHVDIHGYEGWSIGKNGLTGNFYGSLGECGEGEDPEGRYDEARAALGRHIGTDGLPPLCLLTENGISPGDVLPGIPHREMKDSEIMSLFKTREESVPFAPAAMLYEALSPGTKSFDLAGGYAGGKRKAPFITTLILVALLVATAVPYVVVPIEIQKRKIDAIEEQIKARRKDVMDAERLRKETETLQGEIDQIESFKKSKPMSLNVLKGLTLLLPKTVWLTRTRITEETVEIEGYAASATGALSLLEQSDLFQKVEFASPTVKDTRVNSERFVIRMELEGFKKQEQKKEGTVKKDERKK